MSYARGQFYIHIFEEELGDITSCFRVLSAVDPSTGTLLDSLILLSCSCMHNSEALSNDLLIVYNSCFSLFFFFFLGDLVLGTGSY